jgi:hypothetical protein
LCIELVSWNFAEVIRFNSFLLDSSGIFYVEGHIIIYISQSFTSSFQNGSFYFFFLPNCPSHTILNRSGLSGHLRLVLDLMGKVFSLSSLSVVVTVGIYRCPLSGWGSSFSIPSVFVGARTSHILSRSSTTELRTHLPYM